MPAPRRPFEADEIRKVYDAMQGPYVLRDRALFIGLLSTGFRVSELLSLRIRDVYEAGQILDDVYVSAQNMKGQWEGRTTPIGQDFKDALKPWIEELLTNGHTLDSDVFTSRKHCRLGYIQAWRIIREAAKRAGLVGAIGTHSCRKSFARDAHVALGNDIYLTAIALGHRNIQSTTKYLKSMDERIKQVALRKVLFK